MVVDDKDDNLVFMCPVAYLAGAMLMPALGGKKNVVFLPNWSPPRIGAPHFQKKNSCGGFNSGVVCRLENRFKAVNNFYPEIVTMKRFPRE